MEESALDVVSKEVYNYKSIVDVIWKIELGEFL